MSVPVQIQIGDPGRPVFDWDPNDCCGVPECRMCGGIQMVNAGPWQLRPGQRVTLKWFDTTAPAQVVRHVEDVFWEVEPVPDEQAYAPPDTEQRGE